MVSPQSAMLSIFQLSKVYKMIEKWTLPLCIFKFHFYCWNTLWQSHISSEYSAQSNFHWLPLYQTWDFPILGVVNVFFYMSSSTFNTSAPIQLDNDYRYHSCSRIFLIWLLLFPQSVYLKLNHALFIQCFVYSNQYKDTSSRITVLEILW